MLPIPSGSTKIPCNTQGVSKPVILYGVQGCGSARHAAAIAKLLGKAAVIEEWQPDMVLQEDALHLTNIVEFSAATMYVANVIPYALLVALLGLDKEAEKRAASLFCKDCSHFRKGYQVHKCAEPQTSRQSLITGPEPISCELARRAGAQCGPDGLLFVACSVDGSGQLPQFNGDLA